MNLTGPILGFATGTYEVQRAPVAAYGDDGKVHPPVYGEIDDWVLATDYNEGDQVLNGGNVYQCIVAGTSGDTGPGPEGQESSIIDGDVFWAFLGKHGTTLSITACVQPLTGRELERLPEGLRGAEVLKLWTPTQLYAKTDSQSPDLIGIDGDTYECSNVERWDTLGSYFKALVLKTGH